MRELRASGAGHGAAVTVAAVFGLLNSGRIYLASGEPSLLALLLGAPAGVALLYVMALLTRNFSRWFGGRSDCRLVRVGIGLAFLPWTVLSGCLLYLLLKGSSAALIQSIQPLLMAGLVYGFALLLLSVSVALGISALRTFASLMLAGAVAFFSITFVLSIFIMV